MTESDIDLFERYLTDELSAGEKTALAQRLDSDPEFQAAFVGYLEESQDLRVMLSQSKAEENIDSPSFSMASSPKRRFQPLAAAAAIGLLLGGLMTSAVWAYAVPKVPKLSRIPVPLADPGFEETATPLPAVLPRTLHRWNGDPSHVISSGDVGVTPKQGRSMLRMEPVDSRRFSRIEQIVDVSHLVPDQDVTVEFSASFFCDGEVDRCKMLIVLRAFTMEAEEISGSTEKLDDQVTSEARKGMVIPVGSSDWHEGSLRMDLPANTKTLVFSIVASDLPTASDGVFRYIDEVEATILTTEAKGIRE